MPPANAAPTPNAGVLVEDDFTQFDPQRWRVETEQPQGSGVRVEQGRLLMDTRAGMTVWLRQRLAGAYRIEFLRQVLVAGQANDRLSDMNLFWGAHDPGQAELLARDGVLESYDSLATYYVGMGGNGNTTTRFRHYDASGQRHLLGESSAPGDLLQAGRVYRNRIEVVPGATRYWVDEQLLFEQALEGLPAPGYFGFRSVWSRQAISRFSVRAL
ncbi:DUF6250 domain-containing protein [Pseudomonas sp. CF161]|uniref:DUF6250 domain-containing protein n=1 Tax=Pseudomonas sp. CF161 TaxID=911241 RepID=UPI0003553104|nr:DUF6250 domain-containing protein [Pseudomonas sp. CF161]EPL06045.1 hypothetical protein CF161_21336 [Pseudomonas sp. CF161]